MGGVRVAVALLAVGAIIAAVGVGWQWGAPWALMAAGVLMMAAAVFMVDLTPRAPRGPRRGQQPPSGR